MVIRMPENVSKIIGTLTEAGYEAYAVGGCVRDAILGREPQDWDITTSALPNQVKDLFKRTIDTGIQHGTVTVMMDKTGYEVTTYRIDGAYEDGRHPVSVEFSNKLTEDLKRRDFTINAMAYNDEKGLVDEFGGRQDLENKVIRCVGSPVLRFGEDALRMMRAIRFSAQLGFTVEENTKQAICQLAESINKISKERICVELNKTILSDRPEYVGQYVECGIAGHVLKPLCDALSENDKLLYATAARARAVLPLRYASLMNLAGREAVYELLKSLKMDNNTIKTATMLVENVNVTCELTPYGVKRELNRVGYDNFLMILENRENLAVARQTLGEDAADELACIDRLRSLAQDIVDKQECYTIGELDIGGRELMDMGITGPAVGQTLAQLLDAVMQDNSLNNATVLLSKVKI